jgi:hypothetical protein
VETQGISGIDKANGGALCRRPIRRNGRRAAVANAVSRKTAADPATAPTADVAVRTPRPFVGKWRDSAADRDDLYAGPQRHACSDGEAESP